MLTRKGKNYGMFVSEPATLPPAVNDLDVSAQSERPCDVSAQSERPCVRGKFFFLGAEVFHVRGTTYGTFRPNKDGDEFPPPGRVELDFSLMAAQGINAVRTYTAPPRWLLNLAHHQGLRVLVGLPVERDAAFLDYRKCVTSMEEMVRTKVRTCAGHPAVLGYSIGNEFPASLVRWHGRRKIERCLERLARIAKAEDPEGLITYVNYPSTEYLCLPFLDFVCFNVYLESQERLEAYLARLQNIATERPLVMAELGLDSLRNGEDKQADVLDWQVRTAFAAGCGGVFVYSWTDQWYRGGAEVNDWKFGLTDEERRPKPALCTVRTAFAEVPFPPWIRWPKISVIVCSHNGARTISDTFKGLQRLEYPNYEVIVVDDGSTDNTALLARGFGYQVISTSRRGLSSSLPGQENGTDWIITKSNHGLSTARNLGLEAARGEIIAYLDDDAYPDPHWLNYLAAAFLNARAEKCAGMGGPNIAPRGDGMIADCVAHAPGGPIHVLITDRIAEHLPGCNMAFRRVALKAIGGFDPQFHVAGDDVDVCWRLQKEGWTLGFTPGAVVWHHRRNSVRAYLKQQRGYGKAEAMLERKWPEKYNVIGHSIWSGRIYTNGSTYMGWRTRRIYHGQWGTAPFQSLHEPAPNLVESLPMMPEWYLLIFALGALSVLGASWPPLRWALAFLVLAVAVPVVQAARGALGISFPGASLSAQELWQRRGLTALLFLLQPLARLVGRLRHGLTFWRRQAVAGYALPRPWTANIWTNTSRPAEDRLQYIEGELRNRGWVPVRGGECDPWDLELRGGILGSARLFLAAEYHGSGRQLLRIRSWPRCSLAATLFLVLFAEFAFAAGRTGAWTACVSLGVTALLIGVRMFQECAAATAGFLAVIRKIERKEKLDVR